MKRKFSFYFAVKRETKDQIAVKDDERKLCEMIAIWRGAYPHNIGV